MNSQGDRHHLKITTHTRREGELGLPELIAMGVGGMIGGGIFSVLGLASVEPGRMTPFLDRGISGAVLGGAMIFVAFEGFQLITNAVHEMKNPEHNVPRGIYGSTAPSTTQRTPGPRCPAGQAANRRPARRPPARR